MVNLSRRAADPAKSGKMAVLFLANLVMKSHIQLGDFDGCGKVALSVTADSGRELLRDNLAAIGHYPKSDRVSHTRIGFNLLASLNQPLVFG